ncbi:MAG TPA: hypothetical protein VMU14_14280, partial [Acidimicrobiales bacterium]|nr:hypothetical protein [Acidimicrobiales bacterium]
MSVRAWRASGAPLHGVGAVWDGVPARAVPGRGVPARAVPARAVPARQVGTRFAPLRGANC